MAIDTKLISQLREMTGAGVGDCKAALEEAAGDLNKAIEVLRKKGAVKAAKKSDRVTNEGVIAQVINGGKIATVGLACETDFVALTEGFIKTVEDYAKKLMEVGETAFKAWAEDNIKNELIAKVGENIQLTVSQIVEGEVIGTYIHSNKKIAAAVALKGGTSAIGNELAMQIAAMSPLYVKPEDVKPEEIEREKEIYREQLKTEGKPEAMWDKIIPGKLNKFYQEVCLLNQPFIKEDKLSVQQWLTQQGSGIEVVTFSRYSI
ncbi:MAG: elongation factor Ts [Candidatus Buchananbacteria bacterium]|nr:elongation factor Ts [Candidatus Buchananbacteria bacterium]